MSIRRYSSLVDGFKKAMQCVPQPVAVVTTAVQDTLSCRLVRRGVTVSSFASISLVPPLVSFCLTKTSRMHSMLTQSQHFAVHILGKEQVGYGVHFAKTTPLDEHFDQFEGIKYTEGLQKLPILVAAVAALQCRAKTVLDLGDHHVWYGDVLQADWNSSATDSLVYYRKSYRSIGDELFMTAFEERFLPFEEWTHEAHLRMAWNYIREHGKEAATPLIKSGILKFNDKNKHRISRGYNETVTMFYIHMVANGVALSGTGCNFEEFLEVNRSLTHSSLLFSYYSPEVINSAASKSEFRPPDLRSLP